MRHPDDDLVELALGRGLAHLVDERHDRLGAFEREALLADVLRLEERLERLGLVELVEPAELVLAVHPRERPLDPGLDPPSLVRVLDVHVLDADRAAVGVAEHLEDVAQLHERLVAAERAGRELAVEVPEREAVVADVEVWVAPLLVLQRIGVGHEVPAHAVDVDQLEYAGLLADLVLVADRDVLRPADRFVRDAERVEDVVVEVALAEQERVDDPQVVAGLGALDDPVVVGRRERHRLAHPEPAQRVLGRALELGRVLQCADPDDRALTLDQARD